MNVTKFFLGCLFVLPLVSPSAAQAQFGDLLKGMKDAAKELEKGVQQPPHPKPEQPTQQQQAISANESLTSFVWENTDEKRNAWKKLVGDAVSKECSANPTGDCVRSSSVIPWIRNVCGKVPPNVRPVDHQDIYRAVCVSDAEWGVGRGLAEVRERQQTANEVARQEAARARQQKEIDERNRKIEIDRKRQEDSARQRELAQENQRSMEAKNRQELEAKKLENQQKMEKLLK